MAGERERPIPDSYWVRPKLLAGEYPGSLDGAKAREKIRALLGAGVTFFLNLTEEGELRPYTQTLLEELIATGCSAEYRPSPIRDLDVPARETMTRILDTIDEALALGHTVYVHCWGGVGRTGTVVGCHLVRHGMTGEQAIAEIARLREGTPDGLRPAPETRDQRRMVLEWSEG